MSFFQEVFNTKSIIFWLLFFCPGLGDGGALLAMVGGAGRLLLLEAVAATELVPPAGYALGHTHLHTSMSTIYFYHVAFEAKHSKSRKDRQEVIIESHQTWRKIPISPGPMFNMPFSKIWHVAFSFNPNWTG
jgi:hypothetical protein